MTTNTWNAVSSKKCEAYCDMNAGYYPVQNYLTECGAKSARDISYKNPPIITKDGYGWVSLNGCLVDKDSKVRNTVDRLTHGKGRHHLEDRYNNTGYKGRGPLIVDAESMLKIANFNSGVKINCGVQREMSEYRFNYLPPENNPQCIQHIIPPKINKGGWVRGGMDTRMELRRVAHACYYKQ